MDRTLSLPPEPRSVRRARTWTRATCRAWDCPADVVDDVVLVASELVGNAVLHGRSPVSLRLGLAGNVLRVDVQDEDARLPAPSVPNPEALGGRGLQIVAALARNWGAEPVPGGKRVWCELALRPTATG